VTEPAIQSTTTIRVRDLQLLADIGINPDEIGRRQPLVVTVELLLNVTEGVEAIAQTVDYRRVSQAAEELAQVHFPLIETFGFALASNVYASRASPRPVSRSTNPLRLLAEQRA